MIIFDLVCEHEHAFEGWFHNAQDFKDQQEQGMIHCPQCASPEVRKVPSAVAIGTQRAEPEPASESGGGKSAAIPAPVSSTQALALYRQLAKAMAEISEDVGASFASEARRMHYQEIPERPIRGQTTDDEFDELREEGIAVLRLPVIKDEDLN